MSTNLDIFNVINDSNRRKILDLLRTQPMNVTQIVRHFKVTQSAISQHLKLLRDANVVETERKGKEIIYHLNVQALAPLFDWVEVYRSFWKGGLSQLGALLDEMSNKSPKSDL